MQRTPAARRQALAVTEGEGVPVLEGALDVWTNYATGWRARWLVIENGPWTLRAATCRAHAPLIQRTR